MEQTFILYRECLVDPFDREDQFSWSECARDEDGDGEVRLEIKGECSLGLDHQSVNVDIKSTLYEATTCLSNERNGFRDRNFLLPPLSSRPLEFRVPNEEDYNSDDWADIYLEISNHQRP